MRCEQFEITYKVVTPLFCGGARGDVAEVRVPSVKGVLRWWWRALAWSRHGDDLDELHGREASLFGSAKAGQSKVIMHLVPSAAPRALRAGDVLTLDGKVVGDGARYLGYGVMEAFRRENKRENKQIEAGQLTRACLEPHFEIKLALRARNLEPQQRASLLAALRALGLLGGIGAKNRKGYGSLVLQSISANNEPIWSPPASIDALEAEIASLLPAAATSAALPAYTALSPRTRVVLCAGRERQSPLDLLDAIGREMVRYRSWGHNGMVLGRPSEKNFKPDHDLMRVQRPPQRHTHPARIVFGLPHNYGKGPDNEVGPGDPDDGDRRASPLLIHVHECGTTPVAVLAFLPATFLPGGDEAKICVGGPRVTITPDPALWQPIHGFLDRFFRTDRKDLAGRAREVGR
jgi:CRISPR-associated protein Cmr1